VPWYLQLIHRKAVYSRSNTDSAPYGTVGCQAVLSLFSHLTAVTKGWEVYLIPAVRFRIVGPIVLLSQRQFNVLYDFERNWHLLMRKAHAANAGC